LSTQSGCGIQGVEQVCLHQNYFEVNLVNGELTLWPQLAEEAASAKSSLFYLKRHCLYMLDFSSASLLHCN